jgi:hypothetical protein
MPSRDLPIRRAMSDPRDDDAPGRDRRRVARVYRGVAGSSTKVRLLRGSTARPRGSFAPRLALRGHYSFLGGHYLPLARRVQRSRGVELWSPAGGALWWSSPRHLYTRARPAGCPSRARRRRADGQISRGHYSFSGGHYSFFSPDLQLPRVAILLITTQTDFAGPRGDHKCG